MVQMEDSRCDIKAKAGQGPEERNGLATDNCSPFILADWFFLCALLKGGLVVHPDWTADTNNTKVESNHSQKQTGPEQWEQIYDKGDPRYRHIFFQNTIIQTFLIVFPWTDLNLESLWTLSLVSFVLLTEMWHLKP